MKKDTNQMAKNRRKQAKILNVAVDSTSKHRVLSQVREKVSKGNKFYIVTPNPEIVMMAGHDNSFTRILNEADIRLSDGIGLAAARSFLSLPNPQNKLVRLPVVLLQGITVGLAVIFNRGWLLGDFKIIKGREFFLDLAKLANKRGWRIFLFGGSDGATEETAKVLTRGLKKIKIEFAQGPKFNEQAKPITPADKKLEKETIQQINKFRPHLLFVALGAPKQEKWVYRWLPELDVSGAMVIGGTFDYVSGKMRLPPKLFERLGLEWLWRFVTQPARTKRILRAFPLFPLKVFLYKLTRHT